MSLTHDQAWETILRLTREMTVVIQEGDGERLLTLLQKRGELLGTLDQAGKVPEGLWRELLTLDEANQRGIEAQRQRISRDLHRLAQGLQMVSAYGEGFREAVFVDHAL